MTPGAWSITTRQRLRRRVWSAVGRSRVRIRAAGARGKDRAQAMTLLADTTMTWSRAEDAETEQPHVFDWIDGLSPGDVLFDVGANIGIYSLYAALARSARVFAFEPEAANAARLHQHIALNGLTALITPYVVALTDREGLDCLHLSGDGLSAGRALHAFGGGVSSPLRQGVYGTTLDAVVASGLPVPTHLKIDVDGLEGAVLAGAASLLGDRRLRSVLIELSPEQEGSLTARLGTHGFGMQQRVPLQSGDEVWGANCIFTR